MAPNKKLDKNEIKFARGFKVPTKETIFNALKTTNKKYKKAKYENILKKLVDHFKPLAKPTNDLDWLAQFCEKGQTFDSYLNWCPISLDNNTLGDKTFIYYVQIGDFKNKNLNFNDLIDYSKRFFNKNSIKLYPNIINIKFETSKNGSNLKIIASLGNKKEVTLSSRYDPKSKNYQILTDSLLKFLSTIMPKDAKAMIGLTEHDLYVEDSDLFVAGLCSGLKRVGVFSCFRYDPNIKFCEENWFDIKKLKFKSKTKIDENSRLLLARTCKLMVHETCHLLGFSHCTFMDCCMNGSGHIEEDYRQSMFLCPIDLKKLLAILDFDIHERYKDLKEFFDKHKCIEESKQLDCFMKAIESVSD